MKGRRVLFVDDDPTFRKVLERELRGFGYSVESFPEAEPALARVGAFEPDVALLDLRLPGQDGLELQKRLIRLDPQLPVVLLTGHGAVPEAVAAMRLGAHDFLTKPASLDVLEASLKRAIEHSDLLLENQRLRNLVDGRQTSPEIVGRSPAAEALRLMVRKCAQSPANVLILGENGTGKELVARSLHESSSRRDRPFVVVNCGAIPESLMESELFGHERGSFTGAERRRVGLLEAAHLGTVFLDEIGELPQTVQPALLRALQFGEIRPVGSERTRHVDLRVVAATNRDILREIEEGRFREDLYYRIATLVIEVPPLRERREDVELLARLFLSRLAGEDRGQGPLELSAEAVRLLAEYDWPGNVRELENALTRLATLVEGQSVRAEDVQRHVVERRRRRLEGLPTLEIEELERMAIVEALRRHRGNRKAAAAVLGVAVKTLYNKIRRYDVRETEFLA